MRYVNLYTFSIYIIFLLLSFNIANSLLIGTNTTTFFNGTIDDIKIYNYIKLSDEQISYEYNSGLNNFTNNILSNTMYSIDDELICSVTPADPYSAGITKNSTKVKINDNNMPYIHLIQILPSSPNTSSNLACYATILDDLNTSLNVEYMWYNGTILFSSGNTIVSNNTNTLITTLSSAYTKKGEEWNCTIRAYDGSAYSSYNSTKKTIINSAPMKPNLISPTNNNHTVRDRKPIFLFNSTDLDFDDINYTININFSSTFECGPNINENISITNYQPSYDLCLDNLINWSVRAYDGEIYSEWSDIWNFTIESYLSIKLVVDSINFGSMSVLESRDTDNGYVPLILENDGNVVVNITKIGANSSLFETVPLDTIYFRYKVDNTTEMPSFDYLNSQIEWANMTDITISNSTLLRKLNYSDEHDTAQIDINVTVPMYEPGGFKSSTIYIMGEQA